MRFFYDAETDSLSIALSDVSSVESEEVSPDVILDYSANGQVVGFDIQHASQHVDLTGMSVLGFMPRMDILQQRLS